MGMVTAVSVCLLVVTFLLLSRVLENPAKEVLIIVAGTVLVGAIIGTSPLVNSYGKKLWTSIGVDPALYSEK